MKFGDVLYQLLRKIVVAYPSLGPFHVMKMDIYEGFYQINWNPRDAPKLDLLFPSLTEDDPLVFIPLVLPMVWYLYMPLFCTGTETKPGMENIDILSYTPQCLYTLVDRYHALQNHVPTTT